MSQFVVRNLEDDVVNKLRDLARDRGISVEEVVREILRQAVIQPAEPRSPLGSRLAARFGAIGLKRDIVEQRGQEIVPPSFDV